MGIVTDSEAHSCTDSVQKHEETSAPCISLTKNNQNVHREPKHCAGACGRTTPLPLPFSPCVNSSWRVHWLTDKAAAPQTDPLSDMPMGSIFSVSDLTSTIN